MPHYYDGDDQREFSDPPDVQQADGWRELDAAEVLEALARAMRARQRLIEVNTPERDEECPYV